MKAKKILTVALLVFVAASLGWLVIRGQGGANEDRPGPSTANGSTASKPQAEPEPEPEPESEPDRVIVYYFHTDYRCPTCHKIENYTKEVVEREFEKELKDGRMEFHVINVEEQGNEHYVEDYKLHTKSVVVSDMKDGKEARWKNLEKVWELVGNKENFFKYIEDEVNLYLQEK